MDKNDIIAPTSYSQEDKDIFLNYFVLEGKSCKVNFKNYVVEYVKSYGKLIEEDQRVPPRHIYNVQAHDIVINYEYNTHNIMWGNENNDNLVTYITSHPDFYPTNAKMKALNFLRPNWNHINNEGNNVLHCLAKKGAYSDINELLKKDRLDTELKNNNGDYYTHLLLSPSAFPGFGNISHNDNFAFIRVYSYVNKIMEVLADNSDHFLNSPHTKIVEIKENVATVKANMMKFLDDNPKYDKNKSMNIYQETFTHLDKFINDVYLQTKVPSIEKITNRVKI